MQGYHKSSTSKTAPKEDLSLFSNKENYKFFFLYKPLKVPNSFIGISLLFAVRFLGILYAFRSLQGIAQHFNSPNSQSKLHLVLNSMSILTLFLLYFSIYLKNHIAAVVVYYSYLFHFIIKLILSCILLVQRIIMGKHLFNVVVGAGLGLLVGSFINCASTWVMFSFMVYSKNVEEENKFK